MKLLFPLIVGAATWSVTYATPREYWKHTRKEVIANRDRIRQRRSQEGIDNDPTTWALTRFGTWNSTAWADSSMLYYRNLEDSSRYLPSDTEWKCGDESSGQLMWFTENQCSIATINMTYLDPNNNIRGAKKGEIIAMACDSVLCPVPAVPDCYNAPDDVPCAADEWCMLNHQELWDTAAGLGGHTSLSQMEFCTDFNFISVEAYHEHLLSAGETKLTPEQTTALFNSGVEICGGYDGFSHGWAIKDVVNAWRASRGRCVKYRQEHQSCIPEFAQTLPGAEEAMVPKMEDGSQYHRPLLCDKHKELVCTGTSFEVSPSACVKERPADVCFQGPWWDST